MNVRNFAKTISMYTVLSFDVYNTKDQKIATFDRLGKNAFQMYETLGGAIIGDDELQKYILKCKVVNFECVKRDDLHEHYKLIVVA